MEVKGSSEGRNVAANWKNRGDEGFNSCAKNNIGVN